MVIGAVVMLGWSAPVHGVSEERGVHLVVLTSDRDVYPLGRYLECLEDPNKQWTFQDVVTGHRFRPCRVPGPSFGYTPSAYWFRFAILDSSGRVQEWWLETGYWHTQRIDLYVVSPSGAVQHRRAIRSLPISHREVRYRHFVFRLRGPLQPVHIVYLRMEAMPMVAPLTLWSPNAFLAKVRREYLVFGLYLGIILAIAFYSLAVFLSIRDPSYLLYIAYITGVAMTQLCLEGVAYEFFWPRASLLWNEMSTNFFIGFTGLWLCLFTRAFLRTFEYAPRWLHRLILVWTLMAFPVAAHRLVLFRWDPTLMAVRFFTTTGPLIILMTGVACWLRGYRPARYFVLALSSSLTGYIIYTFYLMGLLPGFPLIRHVIRMGSSVEVILLSMALAERIRTMRMEKERAEQQALLDPLTGVANRRYFDEFYIRAWYRSVRYQTSLSLVLADIDFFKAYNDVFGHRKGDVCLQKIATVLYGIAQRAGDLVARYGGEEFAVVLPDTDASKARMLAERMRQEVEALKIPHPASPIGSYVTISLGVATVIPSQSLSPNILIDAADAALYRAKRTGRNRVEAVECCGTGEEPKP